MTHRCTFGGGSCDAPPDAVFPHRVAGEETRWLCVPHARQKSLQSGRNVVRLRPEEVRPDCHMAQTNGHACEGEVEAFAVRIRPLGDKVARLLHTCKWHFRRDRDMWDSVDGPLTEDEILVMSVMDR